MNFFSFVSNIPQKTEEQNRRSVPVPAHVRRLHREAPAAAAAAEAQEEQEEEEQEGQARGRLLGEQTGS